MKKQIVELLREQHAMSEPELAEVLGFDDFEKRHDLRRLLLELVETRVVDHFRDKGVDWYCLHDNDPGMFRRILGKVA